VEFADARTVPATSYARNGDVHIAYQVVGQGPITFVSLPPIVSNIDLIWEESAARAFLLRLGTFCRFVHYDKRGQGMSDRTRGVPTMDDRLADLAAVLDAVGTDRVVLGGISEGGTTATMFAATHPDRVERLLLFSAFAAPDVERGDQLFPAWAASWGGPQTMTAQLVAPSRADDADFVRWLNRYERQSTSPGGLLESWAWIREVDLRAVLPSVQCPTLVMQRLHDALVPRAAGQELAAGIPGARLTEFEGSDHVPWHGEQHEEILDRMEEFITGHAVAAVPAERVLATVMLTDIVDSTARAAALGDRAWRLLLDRHDRVASAAIDAHGGRLIKSTGDGVLATFDAPGRAIRCAQQLRSSLADLDLSIRTGLHTGEIELRGEDVGGIGVHIAARIEALAGLGEVLVSRTVRDLVAGGGFTFASQGTHRLKGIPDDWEVFAVSS
jgi:class 3 adenylate cyclase